MIELSNYYVSCVGEICRSIPSVLYGVKMKPKLYVLIGLVTVGDEIIFDLKEVK